MRIGWASLALALGTVSSIAIASAYSITDLVESAKVDDWHAVHNLIADGSDLSVRGPMGFTALHWAGIRGNWGVFAELVEAGAPINAVGSDGGTPLHWACHHDHAEMIELLLDAGADVGVSNRWGRTPLHVAARRGCGNVAKLLLARGADPDATTKEGWTPLHVASMSGKSELVKILETGGADVNATDDDGKTAAEVWRPRPAEAPVVGDLEEYVGIFDLGGGAELKVWRENGALQVREFAPDGLYPVGNDSFSCRREPWLVDFERDGEGAVSGVTIHFLRRSVHGAKTGSPRYVGSKTCFSCHSDAAHGIQYIAWLRSRHSHAYWRLGTDWALYLAKLRPHYGDLENPRTDQRCLQCHVTGRLDDNALLADSYRIEEGIGCETCHGPGSDYATAEAMSDHQAFLSRGGRIPDETTCRSCHRRDFDWGERWTQLAHPLATQDSTANSGH